jgi:hypothetical protein
MIGAYRTVAHIHHLNEPQNRPDVPHKVQRV